MEGFSVCISKNIDSAGLLGGLDKFIHVGCLIHSWLLVDTFSFKPPNAINIVASICLFISRAEIYLQNRIFSFCYCQNTERENYLHGQRVLLGPQQVASPFGAHGVPPFCPHHACLSRHPDVLGLDKLGVGGCVSLFAGSAVLPFYGKPACHLVFVCSVSLL